MLSKKNRKNRLDFVTSRVVQAGVVAGLIFCMVATFAYAGTPAAVAAAQEQRVKAGGGDDRAPLTTFSPEKVKVNVGESVTWYNPSTVGEPHTVTFVFDNKTMPGIVSPVAFPNSTKFTALPPGSNSQPAMVPGKSILISINARSFSPTVIDSQGNVKMFAPPDAKYTLAGNEKYVNSGWLLPKGMEKDLPGSGNTFTVSFQKPGTYDYLCVLHPWMKGQVVVK